MNINVLSIIALLMSTGCTGKSIDKYGDDISDYRKLIGLTITEVEQIFGKSKVVSDNRTLHDPEEHVNGLKIVLDKSSIFLEWDGVVKSVQFSSPNFKTDKGSFIGQKYCVVMELHPEASFSFGYSEGGFLRLIDEQEGMLFEFDTSNLPLGQYVIEGGPSKKEQTLCDSALSYIKLK